MSERNVMPGVLLVHPGSPGLAFLVLSVVRVEGFKNTCDMTFLRVEENNQALIVAFKDTCAIREWKRSGWKAYVV
jgi:hypothetical protein